MAIPRFKEILRKSCPRAIYRSRFSPIGLDIGSTRIKLVQLAYSGGVTTVYRRTAFPAPEGLFQGRENGFPSALSETLKEAIQKTNCFQNRVQLCLHSQAVTLRRITLPLLSPPEIARAMRWETEKQLPLSPEESVFDYAYLDRRNERGNTVLDFVLAAVPKAVTEGCAEAALRAGLYPEAIESAPFALRRAVDWCGAIRPHPLRETLLVVHIGAENSDLLVLHQGRYRFYRPLNLGVSHFAREAAISRLSPAESQTLLGSAETLLARGLTETALKLARQIARSLEFYAYETDYPEKQCRAALLCGGGAMIPGLDTFLTNELALETIRFDPLSPPFFKAGGGNSRTDAADGPLYAAALGLALRGWAR